MTIIDRSSPPAGSVAPKLDAGHGTGPAKSRRFQNGITLAVAGIAIAAQAQGMWRFFGDVFRIDNLWLRGALFAFIELAILASALRARRHRIDHGKFNLDAIAVWVLAVLSGFLASTDARDWREAAGRFAVPLVAAWMFERAISVERKDAIGGSGGLHWRVTPERIMVWLRLAEAVDRSALEVDRNRRLASAARSGFRLHTLPTWATWRRRRATRRLHRHLLAADEHLNLGIDRTAMHEVRARLAVLFQAPEGTSPNAVADLVPWRSDPRAVRTPRTGRTPARHVGGSGRRGSGQTPPHQTPDKLSDPPAGVRALTATVDRDGADLARLRDSFPDQTPSINEVQRLVGGGRARAIRLRGLHDAADQARPTNGFHHPALTSKEQP